MPDPDYMKERLFEGITMTKLTRFGVFGWIAGAAGAYVFNLAARWAGGLELDIEQ